jgi:hypothetical protein
VAVATGAPRFRLKHMPTATRMSELRTEISGEIGLFCIADESDTFILHNRFVGGDAWRKELGNYTDAIWETVVLRSSTGAFEELATGHDSTGRLEWSGGSIAWSGATVELLLHDGAPVIFGVGGALVYTTSLDGTAHEFLVELELAGSEGEWRLKRSAIGPNAFALARHEPAAQASA